MKVIFPIIVFLLSISLAGEALSASQADKESYTIYSVKKGDSLWETVSYTHLTLPTIYSV